MVKAFPLIRYLTAALVVFLTLLRLPALSAAVSLNLAHLNLMHWSPFMPDEMGERLLERAVILGENAGPSWFLHGHGQRARMLLAQMQSADWIGRSRCWQAFVQGQQFETQGQLEAAISVYQEAVTCVELRVQSLYALYRLSRGLDLITAEEHLNHLAILSPMISTPGTFDEQYQLLGFDLDLWNVAWNGSYIPITVYWQVSTPVDAVRQWEVSNWQYIQVWDRLYQIGRTANLLPNGGFEQDLSSIAALPLGYQHIRDSHLRERSEIVDFLHQYHGLTHDWRGADVSQVVAVTGRHEQTTGFSTASIPVETGALYLLSGEMRTTDLSEGYLGGVWASGKTELRYWKVANWASTSFWRQYAAVMAAPEPAAEFRFMALQRGAGAALFDNVLFCKLALPDLIAEDD